MAACENDHIYLSHFVSGSNNFRNINFLIFFSLVPILNLYVLWHERHEMHKLWMNLRLSILCVSILIYRFRVFLPSVTRKYNKHYAYTMHIPVKMHVAVFSSYRREIMIRACRAISEVYEAFHLSRKHASLPR